MRSAHKHHMHREFWAAPTTICGSSSHPYLATSSSVSFTIKQTFGVCPSRPEGTSHRRPERFLVVSWDNADFGGPQTIDFVRPHFFSAAFQSLTVGSSIFSSPVYVVVLCLLLIGRNCLANVPNGISVGRTFYRNSNIAVYSSTENTIPSSQKPVWSGCPGLKESLQERKSRAWIRDTLFT